MLEDRIQGRSKPQAQSVPQTDLSNNVEPSPYRMQTGKYEKRHKLFILFPDMLSLNFISYSIVFPRIRVMLMPVNYLPQPINLCNY